MKRTITLVLVLACLLPLGAQTAAPAATTTKPKDTLTLDSSYALGMLMASQIKGAGLDISIDEFVAGVRDYLGSTGTRLSQDEAQAAIQAAVGAAQAKKSAAAQAESQAYLAANKAKAGVKVTASGLQYEVLIQGSGSQPKATDTVTVNYEGRLVSGAVFDSSYARGEPVSFVLNEVIRGWTEGVQLMPTGSKYRFTIPAELGYGEEGAGEDIPPNAVLVFDVELISIGVK